MKTALATLVLALAPAQTSRTITGTGKRGQTALSTPAQGRRLQEREVSPLMRAIDARGY